MRVLLATCALPFVSLLSLSVQAQLQPQAQRPWLQPQPHVQPPVPVSAASPAEQRRALRDAVEAHRAAEREEVRRDEAAAGRRLTPAERAQLREQVRRQAHRHDAEPVAEAPVAVPQRGFWSSLFRWRDSDASPGH